MLCSVSYVLFVSADGTDFVDPAQRISFSQSGQISCADVEILRDNTDEMNETFTMELIFNYAPFDLPLDTLEVTIVDSGELTVDGATISVYICLHNHACDHGTTSDKVSVYTHSERRYYFNKGRSFSTTH